jgi:hypothetical protein
MFPTTPPRRHEPRWKLPVRRPEALSWSGDEDGGTVYAITREISQCRVGLV